MRHSSVILRAALYFVGGTLATYAKEFKDIGAAKLMSFNWADWMILNSDAISVNALLLIAYFDRSFGNHMQNGGGPEKPLLTAEDFHKLMTDWQAGPGSAGVTASRSAGAELPKTV